MRIAFIVYEFPSLTQTFVLESATGLIDRGHSVDIFAVVAGPESPTHPRIQEYGLRERTRYLPEPLIAATNDIERLKDTAIRDLLATVFPASKSGEYDVIHCQFGTLGKVALWLKEGRILSGRVVASFRGFDATKHLANNPGCYDQLFEEADLLLPVSLSLQRRLLGAGCEEEKLRVHHSGIDLSRFEPSERRRLEGQPTRLVTVARFVEKKGVRYAIEAVARLVASGRRLTYDIVGEGELRDELERLISELGAGEEIRLLGWRDQREVIDLLKGCHVLVAPSVTAEDGDQEGIPNVLKEAMASGMPVVSTTHSGVPELVEDGTSGFLVAERDVEALTERLAYLIDHPQVWPVMGGEGRSRVERDFDIVKLNDALVGLYRDLL